MTTASREFQVMAKPLGALCNLDCRCCHSLDKQRLDPDGEPFRMDHDLLEPYIVQHLAASPGPLVNCAWHGGEATLLGLEHFETVVALQQQHRAPGQRITNGRGRPGHGRPPDAARARARGARAVVVHV